MKARWKRVAGYISGSRGAFSLLAVTRGQVGHEMLWKSSVTVWFLRNFIKSQVFWTDLLWFWLILLESKRICLICFENKEILRKFAENLDNIYIYNWKYGRRRKNALHRTFLLYAGGINMRFTIDTELERIIVPDTFSIRLTRWTPYLKRMKPVTRKSTMSSISTTQSPKHRRMRPSARLT